MNKKVLERFTVQSYESDFFCRLKPFFLQNHMQELAYKGSEFCGASYDQLREDDFFWALNRIHISVSEWPEWREEVYLQSWSRAKQGPLWHRNFKMFREGEEDSPLMLGTSAWTMLNIADRSICRGTHGFNEDFHLEKDTLPFCSKIIVPKDIKMQDAGNHIVSFSELDTNGHANNCFYTQWAIDTLPFDYISTHILSDLRICYYHELQFGDNVQLQLGNDTKGKWYLQGMLGDTTCFLVEMQFIPTPQQ